MRRKRYNVEEDSIMCGRIDLHNSVEELAERFGADIAEGTLFNPGYNFAPTEALPVILPYENGRLITLQRWGMIPFSKGQPPLFNARSDKLMELGRYRVGIEKRRCVIPISGFYEWKRVGKDRIPYHIHALDRDIVGLAGFWEGPNNRVEGRSCTVITTDASEILSPMYHRMPVILTREAEEIWLDPEVVNVDELVSLMQPYADNLTGFAQVGPAVNKAANKGPECLTPDTSEPAQLSMFG